MVRTHLKFVALAASLAMACSLAKAAPVVELKDQNSLVSVDLGSDAGVQSWEVNGVNHLVRQWFWIGVGDNAQVPLNELGRVTPTMQGDSGLEALFSGADVQVTLKLFLSGSAAEDRTSDLSEIIKIQNVSQSRQTIHFFQYVDFDLNDMSIDVAQFTNNNAVQQHSVERGLTVSETVVTPSANHREIGIAGELLAKLNSDEPITLADNSGPVIGDVAWSFQWDYVLNAGQTLIISKDKNLKADPVPLPASVWMGAMLLGGIGITSIRRRFAA